MTSLLLIGLAIFSLVRYLSIIRAKESDIPADKNRVRDPYKYASKRQYRNAVLWAGVGVLSLTWVACHYWYKLENPYKEPGSAIAVISIIAGLFFWLLLRSVFPDTDSRETATCPNCEMVYLREDMISHSIYKGSNTFQGTRTEKADVKNSSGEVIGTMDYSTPYSYTTSNYEDHYACKSCGHKW